MREALSACYAFVIRNCDTPESREKVDRALGLYREPPQLEGTRLMTKEKGTLVVTDEGLSALDAFMAAHSKKPAPDIGSSGDDHSAPYSGDMTSPEESA